MSTLARADEQTIILERRGVYGYGVVEMLAALDDTGILRVARTDGQCRLRYLRVAQTRII